MKKKKTWIVIVTTFSITVLFAWNIWKASAEKHKEVKVIQLKEEEIIETVMIPGQLKLAEEQTIYYTPENGKVKEILVKEDDKVDEGTPLIRYENNELKLEQEQNELQLRSMNLQINYLQEEHQNIDNLLEEYEDNEQLQHEHNQIKLQEQQANIELEQLKLQAETLKQYIDDLEVKSEISGTIIEVNEQAKVSSDQVKQLPLIRIGTIDRLIVEGVISEYDTLKVEEGQPVKLSSEAVPEQYWEGEVIYISDLPKEMESLDADGYTGGVQYPIEVTVNTDDMTLKPGFQMIVEIKTNEYLANTLPITAVIQDNGVNYVYVVNNGKAERREVEVGFINDETIEITDGVTKEDQIIANPQESIKNGMDVIIK